MLTNAALILALFGLQDDGGWRIVFERDAKMWSAREDGSDVRPEAGTPPPLGTMLSPDRKRRAYVSTRDGDAEIWVSDTDGANAKKLTDNDAIDNMPAWTPDGRRMVFASTRSGRWQVWIMDADGGHATRLTDHRHGAWHAEVSPKGDRIAYLALSGESGKLPPSSLVVTDLDGRNPRTLIESAQLLEHAWSPEGTRIACSADCELRLIDIESGKLVRTLRFEEIDRRLYAHGAGSLVWRPDGAAVACSIRFLGGRMAGAKVFGDDEIFVISMEGPPHILEFGGPARPQRWIR